MQNVAQSLDQALYIQVHKCFLITGWLAGWLAQMKASKPVYPERKEKIDKCVSQSLPSYTSVHMTQLIQVFLFGKGPDKKHQIDISNMVTQVFIWQASIH